LINIAKNLDIDVFSKEKIDPWLTVLGDIKNHLPEELALFLISRGIKNIGSHPHLLLQASFDSLNQLISTNRISSSCWYQLDKTLPDRGQQYGHSWDIWGHWNDWDHCKVLRNGIIETYINHNMPIEDFIYITNDKNALDYLLEELESVPKSKYFLRDLLKFIIKSDIDIYSDLTEERQLKFNNTLKK
jgi:hypothetical protein